MPQHGMRLPDDPRELCAYVERFRTRLLPHAEALEVSDDELQALATDLLALQEAVRGLTEAEAAAREWRLYYHQLLRGVDVGKALPAPPARVYRTEPPKTLKGSAKRQQAHPGLSARLITFLIRLREHAGFRHAMAKDLEIEERFGN
jgi:hypothetical protein